MYCHGILSCIHHYYTCVRQTGTYSLFPILLTNSTSLCIYYGTGNYSIGVRSCSDMLWTASWIDKFIKSIVIDSWEVGSM